METHSTLEDSHCEDAARNAIATTAEAAKRET